MRELKLKYDRHTDGKVSRTPPGVRELKHTTNWRPLCRDLCRTPPGVRELKHLSNQNPHKRGVSRTPPGVRELKLGGLVASNDAVVSHPSRGA